MLRSLPQPKQYRKGDALKKLGVRVDNHSHRIVPNTEALLRAVQLRKQPLNNILVEHALVINLPRSTDRLASFKQHNIFDGTTNVIEAVDGMELQATKMLSQWYGDSGCLASHKKALEYAKSQGWACVLILEDDVKFVPYFNQGIKEAMRQLPESWDMLWAGGKDRYPSYPYSASLKVNTGMWGAYGIIVRNTVYDFFIEKFSEDVHSTDDYYSEYHAKFNSFKTSQDLILHIGNVSDRVTTNKAKKNG